MMRLIAFALFLSLALVAPVRGQVSGVVDWASLGLADEAAIPSGSATTSVGVTATTTWSTIVSGGGSFVAYAGNDFVSYDADTQGGFTGYMQVGFDNAKQDDADKVIIDVAFSEAISNLAFTITDIDESTGGWDDFVEVFYDTGTGYINAKTGAFATLGPSVVADDETFGDGWEGNAPASSATTDGNLVFDFGALQIVALRIVYFSSDDAGNNGLNPGGQQMGISNLTFEKLVPDLMALKSAVVYDPTAAGLYMVPGNDVLYTISITNNGAGAADANTLFIVDDMPAEVEFYNGDVDGAGPATGPVAFSQSGAGLTFNAVSDVAYSNAGSPPANFTACTYIPIAGYDPAVTYLCVNPKGAFAAGSPSPTVSVSFRARIK